MNDVDQLENILNCLAMYRDPKILFLVTCAKYLLEQIKQQLNQEDVLLNALKDELSN